MFNDLINASFLLVVVFIAGLVAIVGGSLAIRFWGLKKRKIKEYEEASLRRCVKCGYVVEKLDIPRCPECGAVIGFTKTFAELGISDEELREAHEARLRRADS